MKKPTVIFDSNGESGNIFAVLGLCATALNNAGTAGEYTALQQRVFNTESYDLALVVIREHVELIDIQGEK